MKRLALAALVCAALAAAQTSFAQSRPAKPRPITREWQCENGRVVLVNYHPRRIREPAWLTYLGNRVEIARVRVGRDIVAASADGKIHWNESADRATLEYAGLLDAPLACVPKPKNPAK
ncbi:hypothetical protein FBR04_05245 [Betaproteobacteria bacterium PRO7]|jgi:hypothetical protein|nr:hypothetical protein [Burkholderiaceae bacterium]MDL1860423.1 hypothetical protein [Betaproteobacteria bacterium PRO7]GIL04428.1 MAG: hypothetical protein BroJett031_09480 [Betaproteobacteria bacterium]